MEMVKKLEPVALMLMIIGALNWAVVALFDTNVITEIFGTGTVTDVVYVLVRALGRWSSCRGCSRSCTSGTAHPRGI